MKTPRLKWIAAIILFTTIPIVASCSSSPQQNQESHNIIVYGDNRPNGELHDAVVDAMLTVSPDIVFSTGDLVNDGNQPGQWTEYNIVTRELREIAAFYPAAGNHENESVHYYNNFDLPNNEKWYAVDMDGIHFIVLNSNLDLFPGSEQYEWLSADLLDAQETSRFIIAIFHHPLVTSGPHTPDETGTGQFLLPLFETYGVDIVFNGHQHLYERSYRNGIYHVVTGGGGAPLYATQRKYDNPFSQKMTSVLHFCLIKREGDSLLVKVLDVDHNTIDSFRIDP